MGWKENEVKDLQLLQINHEEMVKFLPGLCLMFAFEPHLEDTLERSTFLFWICTYKTKRNSSAQRNISWESGGQGSISYLKSGLKNLHPFSTGWFFLTHCPASAQKALALLNAWTSHKWLM